MSGGGSSVAGGSMHIVMFPWLAFGHISPFAQLARTLVSGEARVTFLTAAGNLPRVNDMLASATGAAVAVVPLQLPRVPGLPEDAASTAELSAHGAELLKVAVDGTRPQVAALLAELRPDAVLFDFAVPWVCSLAAPLGVKALQFSVFSAVGAFLAVPARRRLHGPRVSAGDLASPPAGFPPGSAVAGGVPAYQAADFVYMFTSFGNKPVLLAGPVVPPEPRGELEERWATWLSSFPDGAVVFASFGSEMFLPVPAAAELLLGLEATNRPFLAVLNFPKGVEDAEAELHALIPPGFNERVKGRGVVHTGWVQQQHILRHRSVGCFVNHAGFSSVVEGLVAGCRLVMLPMKGDQFLNAALFARELRVGVEVARRDEDGWFGSDDVSAAITTATADGGDGEGRKWREFLTDDAVQKRFADNLVRDLKSRS